ncbi:MAG: NlpC/P60 family protein [Candidatus Cyclobacteriaceae bacterium M3_2C_046]
MKKANHSLHNWIKIKLMLKKWYFLFFLFYACESGEQANVQLIVDQVAQKHAPDSRTVRFDIQVASEGNNLVLKGETNLVEARNELLQELAQENIEIIDSIQMLPTADLEGKKGVVQISVANLRSDPAHSAELATQALLGTPLNVLKKQGSWFLVQTPDNYIAWLDEGGFSLMDQSAYDRWVQGEKLVYTASMGFCYDQQGVEVSDLVAGNILKLDSIEDDRYRVGFPDGRQAYIDQSQAIRYQVWLEQINPQPLSLVRTSQQFMGLPYLWGGTSLKGVDCSGLTKTIYFLNGWILPRDASQQVRVGKLVDEDKNFQNLQPGDLLFFGRPAQGENPERVVHVGMWLGNMEYIHASGRVRINSMDPQASNFDEYNHNRYLRTKRVAQTEPDVIPVEQVYGQ